MAQSAVRPRGRPKGIWTPQIVRERIQTTKIADRLQNHILGKVKMQATQVRAAEILLRKALPDLQAIEGDLSLRGQVTIVFDEVDRKI